MTDEQNLYIDALIERIALCQSRGDAFFPDGIFPSYRHNKYLFYRRPDTNIFYTATIVFILNQIKEKVSAKSQTIIEQITAKAIKNYPDFQNKDGLKTYNFWKTKPSKHFPNGRIFKHFDHFRIPDDIDDTALIYLTLPHSKEDVLWLKEKVKQHTRPHPPADPSDCPKEELKKGVRGVGGYSTWFGKNMPIEHDVCALCNLMYLFEKHQLPHMPHNEYDEAVFVFLREVILQEKYINDAFKVAHNYATTPLIIYHYARLLGDFEIPQLEVCRGKLISKIKQLLDNELNTMNRMVLETSLLKLDKSQRIINGRRSAYQLSTGGVPLINYQFTYFIAGLLSSYENPILYFFAPFKITQMEWECEAHELALTVERTVATVACSSQLQG